VLPTGACVCQFCDSSFSTGFSALEDPPEISSLGTLPRSSEDEKPAGEVSGLPIAPVGGATEPGSWRGELAQRLKAYRTRRKLSDSDLQSHFSFEESPAERGTEASIAIAEGRDPKQEFAFTIAIGRSSETKASEELPVEIHISAAPDTSGHAGAQVPNLEAGSPAGLYPVACIDDRRLAAVIDLFCLLFAYGGFLGLFGSLGGHFTLSKLSAAVCVTTFAIVYLQYFALFTIFGGTTPGMMMRGLQVVSFSGEAPGPRQMLLRSVGYLLSAGTFFLGFLWALWDSDELTWHDRLSRTYLSEERTLPDVEVPNAARSR